MLQCPCRGRGEFSSSAVSYRLSQIFVLSDFDFA